MSEESVAAVRAVQEKYEAELLSRANVLGVAVGLVQVDAHFTDEIALIVLVRRKLPLEQLARDDQIPRELAGVRVDIQEIGEPYAQNPSVD